MRAKTTAAGKLVAGPPCRVGIAGFGTVGRSVARILCEHPPEGLELVAICNRNIERKKVPWVPARVRWTEQIEDLLSPDIDIFVELIGGLLPAEDWIRRALQSGKSVVTANKQLISERGPELMDLARRGGRRIGIEASVAGGIPVVRGLREGLAGDRLFRISGILNGTCNYVLTRMEASDLAFSAAVKEAQALGFAEADPTDDIAGYDARAKLAILARVGLRSRIQPSDIRCRSIAVIESIDFAYARRLGCTIRQVSRAEKVAQATGDLFAAVQPALVPLSSPLAGVQGSQNLITATGLYGGETVFSGRGAGGDPTAVAVVSDLIAIARRGSVPSGQHTDASGAPEASQAPLRVVGEFTSPHYVRFTVKDRPGIVAALATVFSNYRINIDALLQEPGSEKSRLPFVITLEECSSEVLESALKEVAAFDFHVQPPVNLPVLG